MSTLILRRLWQLWPTLLFLSILSFAFVRLIPGDPVLLMLGERGASPEVYHSLQSQLGLDQPWLQQYVHFIARAVRGDCGTSIVSRRPVLEEFVDRFPATIELSVAAMVMATLIGLPLGIVAARFYGGLLDSVLMGVALIGYSMPVFWWGLLLIMFFSVHLGVAPVSGRLDAALDVPPRTGFLLLDVWYTDEAWAGFVSAWRHLVLPAVVLGTIPLAAIARMTRAALLEVLGEEYIRTARSKGAGELRVLVVHALKNALIPIVTVLGLMTGTLLTGAVLTETLFSWPGIGSWVIKAVSARDYPVIQGALLLMALVVMLVNLTVDIAYLLVNPRLRDAAE